MNLSHIKREPCTANETAPEGGAGACHWGVANGGMNIFNIKITTFQEMNYRKAMYPNKTPYLNFVHRQVHAVTVDLLHRRVSNHAESSRRRGHDLMVCLFSLDSLVKFVDQLVQKYSFGLIMPLCLFGIRENCSRYKGRNAL